jgi:hypothetical protein
VKAFLAVALLSSLALAGCSGGGDGDGPSSSSTSTTGPLKSGKGAISGLLINDVFRPVPGGLVLIQELGLTATSDASGQFAFLDLEPGSYLLRVQADGHEAAPQTVDVNEGEYTETELMARRVFNEGGRIVTTEYSVFVPCAASVPVASSTVDCTFDQSGDSFRAGFTSNFTAGYSGITYLITEMKANKPASPTSGAYKIVVREEGDGDYWASAFTIDSDYIRVTMRLGNISTDDTENGRNVAWENNKPMETAFFPQGQFKGETQMGYDTLCTVPEACLFGESRGVGGQVGVRAKFVQSLFLGEPEVDITTYCVLC